MRARAAKVAARKKASAEAAAGAAAKKGRPILRAKGKSGG
jgi:hypothetical protein